MFYFFFLEQLIQIVSVFSFSFLSFFEIYFFEILWMERFHNKQWSSFEYFFKPVNRQKATLNAVNSLGFGNFTNLCVYFYRMVKRGRRTNVNHVYVIADKFTARLKFAHNQLICLVRPIWNIIKIREHVVPDVSKVSISLICN